MVAPFFSLFIFPSFILANSRFVLDHDICQKSLQSPISWYEMLLSIAKQTLHAVILSVEEKCIFLVLAGKYYY